MLCDTELGKSGPTSIDDCSCRDQGSLEEHSFSDLGGLFKELGMCMIEVGLLVARHCDASQSHGRMR